MNAIELLERILQRAVQGEDGRGVAGADKGVYRHLGTVERENAVLGLFITLEETTRDMRTESVSAGFFHSDVWNRDYARIQMRTVGELLAGKQFDVPPHPSMYQASQRVKRPEGRQASLDEAAGA